MKTASMVNNLWHKVPQPLRAKALETGLYPALRARALTSTFQYIGLDLLAGLLPGTQRVERQRDLALLREFDQMSQKVLQEDAALFADEILPLAALWSTAPYFTPRELVDFVRDGLNVYRRRRTRKHSDLPEDAKEYPEYYQRNFHFQTDGYFTLDSAARYDRQVDLLFGGTADAMRRLWIRPLLEDPRFESARQFKGQDLRILELGCGAGSATPSVLGVFPEAEYFGLDLSAAYLEFAQKRFSDDFMLSLGRTSLNALHWVQGNAEKIPENLKNMDIVTSSFLFHELPLEARINVLVEAHRVLKPGGVFIMVDAAQVGDSSTVDQVLPTFPQSYHEPFFTNYTKHRMEELLSAAGFSSVNSGVGLVSKYVIARKQ